MQMDYRAALLTIQFINFNNNGAREEKLGSFNVGDYGEYSDAGVVEISQISTSQGPFYFGTNYIII